MDSEEEDKYLEQREKYLQKRSKNYKKSKRDKAGSSKNHENGEENDHFSSKINERKLSPSKENEAKENSAVRLQFKSGFKKAISGQSTGKIKISQNLNLNPVSKRTEDITQNLPKLGSQKESKYKSRKRNLSRENRSSDRGQERDRDRSERDRNYQSRSNAISEEMVLEDDPSNKDKEQIEKDLFTQRLDSAMRLHSKEYEEDNNPVPLIPAEPHQNGNTNDSSPDENRPPNSIGAGSFPTKPKKPGVWNVFNDDEEEDRPKLQKLPPPTAIPAHELLDSNNKEKVLKHVKSLLNSGNSKINKIASTLTGIPVDAKGKALSNDQLIEQAIQEERRKIDERDRKSRSKDVDRHGNPRAVRGDRRRGIIDRGSPIRDRDRRRERIRRRSRSRSRERNDRERRRPKSIFHSPKRREPTPENKEIQDQKRQEIEQITLQVRKIKAQEIIASIPQDKATLFSTNISWTHMTKSLLNGRIKSWVTEKIQEILGPQERDLIRIILGEVENGSRPEDIIDEIEGILDEKSENFVIKLWRLIYYETEARKMGLVVDK